MAKATVTRKSVSAAKKIDNPYGKPTCGVLFLACSGFRDWNPGTDSKGGGYLARLQKKSEKLLNWLSPQFELVNPGILFCDQNPRVREIGAEFYRSNVDCVIVCWLSWATDNAWTRVVRDLPDLPILNYIYAEEKIGYASTLDKEGFAEFFVSSDLVGALEGSGSFSRNGRKAEFVAGFPGDNGTLSRIETFAYAAQTRRFLRDSRLGLVGSLNESMRVTWIDPYQYFYKVGPEITFLSIADLQRAMAKVGEKRAKEYAKSLRTRFVVDKGVDDAQFVNACSIALGLGQLAEDFKLNAVACHEFNRDIPHSIKIVPNMFPEQVSAKGIVVVPEGDIGFAGFMLGMRVLTRGSIVSFVEPHYLDVKRNQVLLCHGGPNDFAWAQKGSFLRISPDFRNSQEIKAAPGAPLAWIRIPPGPKTIVYFGPTRDSYKLISFTGKALPGAHSIQGYTHTIVQTDAPVAQIFENIVASGSSQHFAVIEGDARESLDAFCQVMGFDHLSIC